MGTPEDAKLARDREAARRRYRERREAGVCVKCGEAASEPGKPLCRECRERRSAQQKKLRAERMAWGVCTRCGKKLYTAGTRCEECRAYSAEHEAKRRERMTESEKKESYLKYQRRYDKARRERLKAEGICTVCGARKAEPEHTVCMECSARRRQNRKKKREDSGKPTLDRSEWQSYGLCAICGKPAETGRKLCARCYGNCRVNVAKARQANKERKEHDKRMQLHGQ